MDNLLSAALTAMIVVTASFIVLDAANFIMEKNKSSMLYGNAKHVMGIIDAEIKELFFEADGARRSINMEVEGKFMMDNGRIKYKIYDFSKGSGTRSEEDGMLIVSGPVMSAYEKDINNDGETDLVLENDNVLFSIRKINGTIDTSNMITLIRNRETNTDIVPRSTIRIDDMADSSHGSGYSELTYKGYDITDSSIRVHVESDAGIDYTALFTLGAGNDFVSMEVLI